jgi:hypothetical protein
LITVAFHLAFIMGSAALPWDYTSYYLFGGLAVIILGLISYMFTSVRELRAKMAAGSVGEKSPLLGSDSYDSTVSSGPESPTISSYSDETHPESILTPAETPEYESTDPVAISESM